MNKRLIFRILGALSAALIVVSVFVPFVDVPGRSLSLWQIHEASKTLYLPIMIIAFGVLGILLFSINKKTDYTYTGVGAIFVFIGTQTTSAIIDGAFSAYGAGYYFLLIGAVLTAVMTFLLNLKSNKDVKTKELENNNDNQSSLLGKIDNLYNGAPVENPITPSLTMETEVQPLNVPTPIVEPIQPLQPIPDLENNQMQQTANPVLQQFNQAEEMPTIQPLQPISELGNIQTQQPIQEANNSSIQQPANPVLQQFNQVDGLSPNQNLTKSLNNNMVSPQVGIESPSILLTQTQEASSIDATPNPVVQEFSNTNNVMPQELTSPQQQPQLNSTASAMDIFGQPINK